MKFKEFLHIYAIGSITYMFIEVLWRGYTHWTMGVVGGICFTVIYLLDKHLKYAHIFKKALLSAIFITIVEFFTGLIVNRVFNLNVWDYSRVKFNLMGQISLLYSVLWYFLCIPALLLCKLLRHRVFGVFTESTQPVVKTRKAAYKR